METERNNKFDIILIDGNNFVFRAIHAMKDVLLNADGINTTGLTIGVRMLMSYIQKYEPKCVVVCWDMGRPEFRKKMLSRLGEVYKGSRKPRTEEEQKTLSWTSKALSSWFKFSGVAQSRHPEMEADDIIFQIIENGVSIDNKVLIVSSDKDLYQAFEYPNVSILSFKDEIMVYEDFVEEFGIQPSLFYKWKSVAGDSSDNLKGIPGLGKKWAQKALLDYDSPIEYAENQCPSVTNEKILCESGRRAYKIHILLTNLKLFPHKIKPGMFMYDPMDWSALLKMAHKYELVQTFLTKQMQYKQCLEGLDQEGLISMLNNIGADNGGNT